MSETSWARVLAFDCDDPEFSRGFNAGRIYALASDPDYRTVEATVAADQAEMMIRIGEATGRPFRAEVLDDDGEWLQVTFGPVRQERG